MTKDYLSVTTKMYRKPHKPFVKQYVTTLSNLPFSACMYAVHTSCSVFAVGHHAERLLSGLFSFFFFPFNHNQNIDQAQNRTHSLLECFAHPPTPENTRYQRASERCESAAERVVSAWANKWCARAGLLTRHAWWVQCRDSFMDEDKTRAGGAWGGARDRCESLPSENKLFEGDGHGGRLQGCTALDVEGQLWLEFRLLVLLLSKLSNVVCASAVNAALDSFQFLGAAVFVQRRLDPVPFVVFVPCRQHHHTSFGSAGIVSDLVITTVTNACKSSSVKACW